MKYKTFFVEYNKYLGLVLMIYFLNQLVSNKFTN